MARTREIFRVPALPGCELSMTSCSTALSPTRCAFDRTPRNLPRSRFPRKSQRSPRDAHEHAGTTCQELRLRCISRAPITHMRTHAWAPFEGQAHLAGVLQLRPPKTTQDRCPAWPCGARGSLRTRLFACDFGRSHKKQRDRARSLANAR
ncbi:hypothetical protein BC834DRAFT_304478 [Gloeopeniophorella convolvens]|nr:hypothetical protein BC834DRAFT_304478 [Gloeopeniophorella convolvens]